MTSTALATSSLDTKVKENAPGHSRGRFEYLLTTKQP